MSAEKIATCDDCRPDDWDAALNAIERIILGEIDAEECLCQDHYEGMEEATRKRTERRGRSN